MKLVLVTNQGNAWVVECDEKKNGGLNLSDGDFVVSAIPYDDGGEEMKGLRRIAEASKKVMAWWDLNPEGTPIVEFKEALEAYESRGKV